MGAKAADAPVAPGDMLAGKFRIERVVGRGGMGVVVEATNLQLDQKVAVKLLSSTTKEDPAFVERFSNEARAAARLRSEHVARVYDVGKDTIHGPFIVMELLEGKTLAEVIQDTGRVPVHRAAEYVIDACEGLAEAHTRNVIHQDVKPQNLFLVTASDGRPSVKLLDFGIATVRTTAVDPRASQASAGTTGTPAYLAPEQLRAQKVDHRTDIWALGCVLQELLSGERAFHANRFTELVTKIMEGSPRPLPPEVPAPLAAIVSRCLQKDPNKRFVSTGELALALLPFAKARAHSSVARAVAHVKTAGLDPNLDMPSSMPPPSGTDTGTDLISSSNLRAAGVPSFSEAPSVASVGIVPPSPPKSSRTPLVIIALLITITAGGAAVWTTRSRTDTQPTAPSAAAGPASGPTSVVAATTAEPPPPPPTESAAPSVASTPARKPSPLSPPSPPRKTSPTSPSASAASSGTGEAEIRHTR